MTEDISLIDFSFVISLSCERKCVFKLLAFFASLGVFVIFEPLTRGVMGDKDHSDCLKSITKASAFGVFFGIVDIGVRLDVGEERGWR